MDYQKQEIWEVIASVLDGNPSESQANTFNTWLKEDPKNKEFFNYIQNRKANKELLSRTEKEGVFLKVQNSINKQRLKKRTIWLGSVAASFLILFASAYLFYQIRNNENRTHLVYEESFVPYGVKSKLILSDGTLVHLNSGSTLKYPSTFTKDKREVYLSGEAYFEVAKKPDQPFIVQTKDISVKVLGTHFNVKAYENEKSTKTTLIEGSVEVSGISGKAKEKILLKPNQQALYNSGSDMVIVKQVDADLDYIWKDGKFYFENENLFTIAKSLERSFNVTIKVMDEELGNQMFYGIFNKNNSIYQMLDIMKSKNAFKYFIRKDTIFIQNN